MSFKYTGTPRMTQEEFDYKHSENYEWHKLWTKLFYAFIPFFIISLFITEHLWFSMAVIGAQMLFIIFDMICRVRHEKLHDEWEAQNGK